MSGFNMKGKRKYICADCKNTQFERASSMSNRCKARCRSCGSTFLEPYSDGAHEEFTRTGDAKIVTQPIRDGRAAPDGREHTRMPDAMNKEKRGGE